MRPHQPQPSSSVSGFTLVESLAALAIFAVAVLVAAAFLQAHVQASRRLAVRSALVHATEITLEELRSGSRPLVAGRLDRGPESGLPPGTRVRTRIAVDTGGVTDLFHVVVTSSSGASGQPIEVSIETMVWRP